MPDGKQKVFYDVDHYLGLDSFNPPKIRYGLRRVPLLYKITNWVSFIVISGFLVYYLYFQALSLEIANERIPEGSLFSPLFFSSLGGAMIALPLVIFIVWLLRKTFVQPSFIYLSMFLHGAGFSVLAALVISGFTEGGYDSLIEVTQSNPLSFFATVHAPVFEELVKGIGLIFLMISLPFFVRTVHDGAIYGMLIGFGFAFTENIQYFIQYGNTAESFFYLVFMRVFASLLTHAIFTAAIGLVMAYFWCKYGTYWKAALGWLLGLLVAISLHALWNGAASIGLFVFTYVLVFFPVFFAATFLMKKSAERYDSNYIQVLDRYSEQGWFPRSLYKDLFPKKVRKQSFKFMSGKEIKKARYIASALSELVFVRMSIENGKNRKPFVEREREILIALYEYQRLSKHQKA